MSLPSPWIPPGIKLGNEGHLGDFIDGLGPAQIVGRQVLASPSMGDIQLAMFDRKGMLEVEVIRAKGLLPKPGSKILPGILPLLLLFPCAVFFHVFFRLPLPHGHFALPPDFARLEKTRWRPVELDDRPRQTHRTV